jgi:hypothetical protein
MNVFEFHRFSETVTFFRSIFEFFSMPVIVFMLPPYIVFGIFNATIATFLQIDGCTALTLAAMNGKADCVRLLIDAGADKEAKNGVRANAARRVCGLGICFSFSFLVFGFGGNFFCKIAQFANRNSSFYMLMSTINDSACVCLARFWCIVGGGGAFGTRYARRADAQR